MKVYAYKITQNKWKLFTQEQVNTLNIETLDKNKQFYKDSSSLWEYFRNLLKENKTKRLCKYFIINNEKVPIVFGNNITSDELNDLWKRNIKENVYLNNIDTNKISLFTVMNKDITLTGKITIYNKDLLPYDLYLEQEEDFDTQVQNINNFYYWSSSRILPNTRLGSNLIFSNYGSSTPKTDKDKAFIAIKELRCATITDSFWVKTNLDTNKINWNSINLFDKINYNEESIQLFLEGKKSKTNNSSSSSSLSLDGQAPKCLVRLDNDNYIVKKDVYEGASLNEVIASEISYLITKNIFNITSTIRYLLFKNNQFNKCKLATNKDIGLITYQQLLGNEYWDKDFTEKDKENINKYESLIDLVDYLTLNTDRHFGNLGFLVNNETNKLKGFMPLYDFNYSFHNYSTSRNGDFSPAYNSQRKIIEHLKSFNKEIKENIVKILYQLKKEFKYVFDKYNRYEYWLIFETRLDYIVKELIQ